MKKEELNYFNEFVINANFALEISTILNEYIENFDYTKSEIMEAKVHQLENDADKNLHKILNYLIKDFLPPIEREDIITLSHKIDDVVDSIDDLVINLDILDVRNLRDDFNEFITLINQGCYNLKQMMISFKKIKEYEKIKLIIIDINKLEELGDKLYQNAIRKLYQYENNPIEVLKWHTIYNCLENCFDTCENVATCVEEIVLKNT